MQPDTGYHHPITQPDPDSSTYHNQAHNTVSVIVQPRLLVVTLALQPGMADARSNRLFVLFQTISNEGIEGV